MSVRSFAVFEASLATQPDIHAEIAFLVRAIDAPARRGIRFLPLATALTLVVAAAGQVLARQARHVVVTGESLYRIAARELGSGNRWRDIARLNHLDHPSRIMIGQVLDMPAMTRSRHSSSSRSDRIAPAGPVEVVPAGRIIVELPARVPASPNRPRSLERGASSWPWNALDALAFVVGAAVGQRLLALRKPPRASARLQAAAVPAAVPSEFWSYVPASGDLQNLEASCG